MMFTLILQSSDEEVPYDAAGFGLMWATMILSLVNIVLPMDYINEKLFPISDEVTETYTYQKARLSFGTVKIYVNSRLTYYYVRTMISRTLSLENVL